MRIADKILMQMFILATLVQLAISYGVVAKRDDLWSSWNPSVESSTPPLPEYGVGSSTPTFDTPAQERRRTSFTLPGMAQDNSMRSVQSEDPVSSSSQLAHPETIQTSADRKRWWQQLNFVGSTKSQSAPNTAVTDLMPEIAILRAGRSYEGVRLPGNGWDDQIILALKQRGRTFYAIDSKGRLRVYRAGKAGKTLRGEVADSISRAMAESQRSGESLEILQLPFSEQKPRWYQSKLPWSTMPKIAQSRPTSPTPSLPRIPSSPSLKGEAPEIVLTPAGQYWYGVRLPGNGWDDAVVQAMRNRGESFYAVRSGSAEKLGNQVWFYEPSKKPRLLGKEQAQRILGSMDRNEHELDPAALTRFRPSSETAVGEAASQATTGRGALWSNIAERARGAVGRLRSSLSSGIEHLRPI